MNPASDPRPDPRSVAVLHRTGDVIRAVLADTVAQRPRVTAWREFPAAATTDLERWLDDQAPEEVIGIVPAAAVICRTCTLPDAAPEVLNQALRLQAEAHLPGSAPDHRMVMAALPSAVGETSRSGIICAWPDRATPTLPVTSRPMNFCPDVAAIAAILNGQRPADPLLWLDGADGSLALALSHANGAVLRCARTSTETPQAWRESACRVLAETAISVNHTGSFTESLIGAMGRAVAAIPSQGSALIGPDQTIESARERISGTPDTNWWHDYGVAAGAIIARTNDLAPLTALKRDAPVLHPSRVQQIADRLTQPSFAARTVAVCVLVALLAPLVSARVRLAVADLRLPDIKSDLRAARAIQAELAMYEALQTESWPMTKLLADIACNTPEGIELDQIRIRHGDKVQINGSSKGRDGVSAQGLIARMQGNFRSSGIFTDISPTWGDPDNFGAYDFTLTASVSAPFHPATYDTDQDFGAWTLADRLYGNGKPPEVTTGPRNQTIATGGDEDDDLDHDRGTVLIPKDDEPTELAAGEDSEPVRIPNMSGSNFRGDSNIGRRGNMADRAAGGSANLPASADIPEPYTALQVQSMSLEEAKEEWARVSRALDQGRLDDETKERLWADWRLIRARVRELNKRQDKKERS